MFIISSGIWTSFLRRLRIPYGKRRISSSSDTSRKCTWLLAPAALRATGSLRVPLVPEAEIEDYIRSQCQRPACYIPKHGLD